ncbi:D-alanyl-D-alanine carboxypeptidase [Clostridiaceae bacterium UIB06]|uniref:D-alanyl-D-alanine carboxypeptidase n=1 Tax=Clostridium thailandense TaxID=2794346 RepID=A0A949U3M0_9CLOT|nr:D-alanyl-D-alanine carboxypeptidase family protein [Clostridium thailandense]MBV7276781.1 D-alanyl-D-alanine carboxypeptidase [Clostridium thailandense]MCH5136601.1 D-alanyl-D-alanine carboxypeptidase [Clostridiaceae bacterium UIB06]
MNISKKNTHRVTCLFLLTVFIVLLFTPCKVKALKKNNPQSKNITGKNINVSARCAVALDSKSKVVLYEKNAYELVPMASTTKIMTALVALKYGDLDRKIEISSKAASIKGSTVGFKKGEKISIKELVYGLMLRSGNDAAIAIAEGISGSVEEFAKLMNECAGEIGVVNTHFETPHGLDKDEHYSTAYDLAVVTSKAKTNELFNEIVKSKDVDGNALGFTRSYHNINKILWQMPEANGVKTGYTGKAGKCLVSSANIQGNDVIVVVLNCTERWKESIKIFEYVNKNYQFKKMFSKGDAAGEIALKKGNVNLLYDEDVIIPVKSGVEYTVKVIKPEKVNHTVNKGDKIGKICVYAEGTLVYSNDLEAANTIKVKEYPKWIKKIIKS